MVVRKGPKSSSAWHPFSWAGAALRGQRCHPCPQGTPRLQPILSPDAEVTPHVFHVKHHRYFNRPVGMGRDGGQDSSRTRGRRRKALEQTAPFRAELKNSALIHRFQTAFQ